jgi:RimJ/RimL family protein N-acetyltransferase
MAGPVVDIGLMTERISAMAESLTEEKTSEKPKPEPGTGHLGQTFMVGEQVYLRPIEKDDAARSVAIRQTLYPVSPQRTEEWIKDDLAKANWRSPQHFAIVRKHDDVVVGSITVTGYGQAASGVSARVDPLLGDVGQRLRAEAVELVRGHYLDERQVPTLLMHLPVTDRVLVEAMMAAGWVETARHREMLLVDGKHVDRVQLQALNAQWLETLGDPRDIPLERTGTGLPRPVPPKVDPMPDAPKNALMVGKRVYLRALKRSDAEHEVAWSRKETETFFDIGRHLPSLTGMSHWLDGLEKKDIPEFLMIGVYLRENDLYIGDVMLINPDFVNKHAETGSFFHRGDYRGSGYGSEAKQLLLEYAFDVLGLHMVESWVLFPNTRSAAALRKQGYREAGRMCWGYPFEGGFNNGVLFDLLAEEWRAMPRKDWDE